MRVGLVAKGLLLKGDLDLELVLLCKEKPTTALLDKVADNLAIQLTVSAHFHWGRRVVGGRRDQLRCALGGVFHTRPGPCCSHVSVAARQLHQAGRPLCTRWHWA